MISHSLFSDTLASEEGADNVRVMPLSEIQQRVALLLATGHTAREVAQKMGLSEVTIHRWRQQPEFVAAVRGILKQNKQALNERLNNLAIKALEVLEAIIDDPNASTADRINAASKVLDFVNQNQLLSSSQRDQSPSESNGGDRHSEQ
ncbi:MAG: helix-turn-helix domain-containing protein [Desertifilum sp.]|nr:helix-turn-helix domain-containing protein [Desertifilum sp.]